MNGDNLDNLDLNDMPSDSIRDLFDTLRPQFNALRGEKRAQLGDRLQRLRDLLRSGSTISNEALADAQQILEDENSLPFERTWAQRLAASFKNLVQREGRKPTPEGKRATYSR